MTAENNSLSAPPESLAATKILLLEDDAKLAQSLEASFRAQGFEVSHREDGESALEALRSEEFDLLIADVMVPKSDGFQVSEELRKSGSEIPIIFLSAKGSPEDKIRGLQKGGDDYLAKPFSLPELLARVESVLRRSYRKPSADSLSFRDLKIDLISRVAIRGGRSIELHTKEFALLELMMRNPDRIISKAEFLEKIWKYDFNPQTNIVDVAVCRLRSKVDRNFSPKLIRTIRGLGYAIKAD